MTKMVDNCCIFLTEDVRIVIEIPQMFVFNWQKANIGLGIGFMLKKDHGIGWAKVPISMTPHGVNMPERINER